MRLLAIDPGPEESAWVEYDTDDRCPLAWEKTANQEVLDRLAGQDWHWLEQLAIEMIASYGMPVGREVFETCVWIGRFIQAWPESCPRPYPTLITRGNCKLHLCGSLRAKDSNIRQALIDRYGPGREKAVGKKKSPGPLYGMKADCWSALAVAITACETRLDERTAA